MITNPHIGSLGPIEKDSKGVVYTMEDNDYACRYWFGDNKKAAIEWLKGFLQSYDFMMSEAYLEVDPEKCIELVREEWTIKVCFDPGQVRMNNAGW
jgi:hypothetical protein